MTTSSSVVFPVWEKTRLAVARVRSTPFYGPGGGPHGTFKGYHIIGRDTRILGGVSIGEGEREAIAVEDDERLHDVYYALERRIQHYDAVSYADVMELVYDLVRERIPGDHKAVDQVVGSWSAWEDGIVPLSAFLGTGGVCRHASLLSAYLIERLIDEEVIAGRVSTDRNAIPGEGGHMWTRFESPEGEVHILDTMVGYSGPEQGRDGKKPFWKYTRPVKVLRMQVKVARRYVNGSQSVPIVDDARPWRHVGPNERPRPYRVGAPPQDVPPARAPLHSEEDFWRQVDAARCRPRHDPPISARVMLALAASTALLVGGYLASTHLDTLRAVALAFATRAEALASEVGEAVERARTPDPVAAGTPDETPGATASASTASPSEQTEAAGEPAKQAEPPQGPITPTNCTFAARDKATKMPVKATAPDVAGQYVLRCREGLFAAKRSTLVTASGSAYWTHEDFTRLNERYEPVNGDH